MVITSSSASIDLQEKEAENEVTPTPDELTHHNPNTCPR